MKKIDIKLAGIVQGQEEIDAVNRVLHSDWHVSGPECEKLQKEIAEHTGRKYCVVVNSGSSANLLALQALDLPRYASVLTSACGFPATLNPILHLGLTPKFVDYSMSTLQANTHQVIYALENKLIDAVVLAHTLGSTFDIEPILQMCNKLGIPLIEDCCEAMGAMYRKRPVGYFGKVSTFSFYSSHQISGLGGGGALVTDDEEIYRKCKSLRDWGKQNVPEGYICTKLNTKVDGIPYDQQYTYDTIGYNMRLPDANCAYARVQLQRLYGFAHMRSVNYNHLNNILQNMDIVNNRLYFMQVPNHVYPSYFGYPIVLKDVGLRDKMVDYLEKSGVHVRLFFAGNILRHEPYRELLDKKYVVADYLMENAFFCGCWPGLGYEDMEYIANVIKGFFKDV